MSKDHSLAWKKSLILHSEALATFLDLPPCAMGLWSLEHSPYTLNEEARQLTGFSERDFQKDPSLWINRIHPQDRTVFSAAWERLQGGEKRIFCEYSFFPKGNDRELWLRDISGAYQGAPGAVEGVISVYTDISDFKGRRSTNHHRGGRAEAVGIIDGLLHEVQNSLHSISMGTELLGLGEAQPGQEQVVFRGIERASRLLGELQEYFSPPRTHLSTGDLAVVVAEVARGIEKEWQPQGVRLGVVCPPSLARLRLDWWQLRKALERVLGFCCALVPGDGEVEVEAGLQEIEGQRYVELKVTSSCAISLVVEEKEVFQPFLRVNSYQVGLSLMLVRQMLRRHHGEIVFHKEGPQRGLFTILLKVH